MKKLLVNLIYSLAVILFVLLIWYIACWWINVDLILPTPYQAFLNLWEYLKLQEFWVSLGYTYLRCIESFLIAFIIAITFSCLAYAFKTFEKIMNSFMAIIRAIPTMAIILILIIIISPKLTPIIVAGIVICPTLYQTFLSGFKQIDNKLIEMANLYHVKKNIQIKNLYLPFMKAIIIDNSASTFSLNIKLVIAAEALALTRNSIGKLMQYAKINLEVEKLFALTIIAIILSYISEIIIRLLKRVLCND